VESNGPCGLPQTIGGTWQYKMQKIMIDQSVWGVRTTFFCEAIWVVVRKKLHISS
jgi:hypothetical protein